MATCRRVDGNVLVHGRGEHRRQHSLRQVPFVLHLLGWSSAAQSPAGPQSSSHQAHTPHPVGPLQEVSCSLNFGSHTGRGKLSLANPRYSGLRGDWLSGGFRWERDVVRLEKLVLQQRSSRWVEQMRWAISDGLQVVTRLVTALAKRMEKMQ